MILFIFIFIFSIIILIKSIHILNTLNNIREPFLDYAGGNIEFFYSKNCSLCPIAKQKLLKRLDKNTTFTERNLTRVIKERTECINEKCITIKYEDYENESDGKRAESLSIHWTNVPVVVIHSSSIIIIMYINSSNINKL